MISDEYCLTWIQKYTRKAVIATTFLVAAYSVLSSGCTAYSARAERIYPAEQESVASQVIIPGPVREERFGAFTPYGPLGPVVGFHEWSLENGPSRGVYFPYNAHKGHHDNDKHRKSEEAYREGYEKGYRHGIRDGLDY
jgi:hypothetical protein